MMPCLVLALVVNVRALDQIKARNGSGSGDSAQNVGARSLEEGSKALALENLHRAVHRALVVDSRARRHHHATADRVNGVRQNSGNDGDDANLRSNTKLLPNRTRWYS